MSKYTKQDPDVVFMDTSDRVNYEFDMLNHDVDKMVEISYGLSALRGKTNMRDQFKDPKIFPYALLSLLATILVALMIVVGLVFVIVYLMKVQWKQMQIRNVCMSIMLFFVVLCALFYIFSKVLGEMIALIEMVKEKKKKLPSIPM